MGKQRREGNKETGIREEEGVREVEGESYFLWEDAALGQVRED